MSTDSLRLRILAGLLGAGLKQRGEPRPPFVAEYSVARRVLAGVLGIRLPDRAMTAPSVGIVRADTHALRAESRNDDKPASAASASKAEPASEHGDGGIEGRPLDDVGAPTDATESAASSVVTIRSVDESELDALHRLDRLIYGRMAYPYFTLRQLVDLHNRYCVVADKGGELVGYCLGGQSAGSTTGWILALGMLPRARGSGYARDLIREVIRRMVVDGIRQVQLVVDPENIPAIHVYEKLGFRVTGFRPHYFGPEADRLIMTVDTESVRDSEWSEPEQVEAWLAIEAHDLWIGLDRANLPL